MTSHLLKKTSKLPIDKAIEELAEETEMLFALIDIASQKIRNLEFKLGLLKTNFPFSLQISEEQESSSRSAKPEHLEQYPSSESYRLKYSWHLSWEQDEISKKFRLLLVAKQHEIIAFFYNDRTCSEEFACSDISKKPLIETDLQTRLKYSEYLTEFVDAFRIFLQRYRKAIEASGIQRKSSIPNIEESINHQISSIFKLEPLIPTFDPSTSKINFSFNTLNEQSINILPIKTK